MGQQPCSGKPENGNKQRQRIHKSDKMVNYRSKRYSLWIRPKRCRINVKLVGGSYICFCRLGILRRLCARARPGRFRRSLRCTVG